MLLIILAFSFQNCATILGSKKNTLVFSEKSLPAARVYIDGEFIGNAPGKIKLPKGKIQHGSILELKADDGYQDKEYVILRKQNAAYTVVDILTGAIPLVVDYTTGNIYRPSPRKFEYVLEAKTNL